MKTETTPWPDVKPCAASAWTTAWPEIKYKSTDPFQEAADFYIHCAIRDGVLVAAQPLRLPSDDEVKAAAEKLGLTLADIKRRAKRVKAFLETDPRVKLTEMSDRSAQFVTDQVNRLAPCFEAYVHMACGGEIRHHHAIKHQTLASERSRAWVGWKKVFDKYGPEALITMANLFREFNSKSYGDERWAIASEVLYQYINGTLGPNPQANKELFVDRVFTLEHNGGAFLNKIGWANKRTGEEHYFDVNQMKVVLNAHGHNPPDLATLYKFATKTTQKALADYYWFMQENNITPTVKWTPPPKATPAPKIKPIPKTKAAVLQNIADKKLKACTQTTIFNAKGKDVELNNFHNNIVYPAAPWKNTAALTKGSSSPAVTIEVIDHDGNVKFIEPQFVKPGLTALNEWVADVAPYVKSQDLTDVKNIRVWTTIMFKDKGYSVSYTLTNAPKNGKIYGSSLAANLAALIEQENTKATV